MSKLSSLCMDYTSYVLSVHSTVQEAPGLGEVEGAGLSSGWISSSGVPDVRQMENMLEMKRKLEFSGAHDFPL